MLIASSAFARSSVNTTIDCGFPLLVGNGLKFCIPNANACQVIVSTRCYSQKHSMIMYYAIAKPMLDK